MYRPHGRYRYTYGFVSLCSTFLSITMNLITPYLELASSRCHPCFRPSKPPRPYQLYQPQDQSRRCRPSIRHCLATRRTYFPPSPIFFCTCLPMISFCIGIFQFCLASGVFFILSTLFPAKETFLDHAILADDESAHTTGHEDQSSLGEKGSVEVEVK